MCFDKLFVNCPFGAVGVEMMNYLLDTFPQSNISAFGTPSMFNKHYDKLSVQLAVIYEEIYGMGYRLDWGTRQAMLIATNGKTTVKKHKRKLYFKKDFKNMENGIYLKLCVYSRISGGWDIGSRNQEIIHIPGDVPNPNYVYVRFDTEEEAQKALKDISSWKSQSDGHDKLEKWDLIDILD